MEKRRAGRYRNQAKISTTLLGSLGVGGGRRHSETYSLEAEIKSGVYSLLVNPEFK